MTQGQITKMLRYGRMPTTAQLDYLGLDMKKGWKKRLKQIEVTEEQYKTLLKLKVKHNTDNPKVDVKHKIIKTILYKDDLFDGYSYKQAFETLKELSTVYPDVLSEVLRRMKYENFMSTNYWNVIATYLKKTQKKCCKCGSETDLNVHHLTYEHHGDEINHLDDLIVVCRKCHREIHGLGENTND